MSTIQNFPQSLLDEHAMWHMNMRMRILCSGNFGQIQLSPRSTLFYNWHGLIDNWWKK